MRIVDEAVQDGVGVSGVANDLMPGRQGELGGDDGRPSAVSLLENFEQIVTGAGVEGFEAEVVENEQIGAAEGFDEARMAAVASGERQVLAELRPAMIEDGPIVAAGFLADGAGEPAFADAGRNGRMMPVIRKLAARGWFATRTIRASARRFLSSGGNATAGSRPMCVGNPTAVWRLFRSG